jgi:uncharacterized membrane protein YgdD (TMEM256/DUF423 family)
MDHGSNLIKITSQILFAFACVMAATSVLLAAYVAHLSAGLLPPALRSLQSALDLQQFHSLALLMVAWMGMGRRAAKAHVLAGVCFLLGLFLFSVNIQLIHLADVGVFRALTPYGGMAFVAGWLALLWALRFNDQMQ